jgi:hypothetical protein
MNEDAPRRWPLISRELSAPFEEEGREPSTFITQGAVPALGEVKRSSGTRIRREVVGENARLRLQRGCVLVCRPARSTI